MKIVIAVLLLISVAHADELEARLERLARDVKDLRSETRLVQERAKLLERVMAETERRMAALRETDGSALGATRIEKLRQGGAALEKAWGLKWELLRRHYERVEARIADAESMSDAGGRPLLQERIARALRGDAAARADLKTLRARLVKEVPGIERGAGMLRNQSLMGWGNNVFGIQGRVRVLNGVIINRAGAPASKPRPKAPKRVLTPEERKKAAEEDRKQQEQRARLLEAQVSALSGKIVALEEQLGRKRAKVANPPPR